MVATVRNVSTPSDRLRRPVASNLWPLTGARTAMKKPAMPSDHPSQVLAEIDPGRSSPTASVR